MEQQPNRACEETKSKQKQNQVQSHLNRPRVSLFNLAPPKNELILLNDGYTV